MAVATLSHSAARRLNATAAARLVRAAHPRQAALITTAFALAAALSGRPGREIALVALTVGLGQVMLGWHNDLVDSEADRRHQRIKPLVDGLDRSTLTFALSCAVLLIVPLAVSNGVVAAAWFGLALVSGVASNLRNPIVRMGPLSWVPWAISGAAYVAFLTSSGWGGQAAGHAPSMTVTALAALFGVGVHVLTAVWGLIADDADGWSSAPLWLARRWGATTVLIGTVVYLGVIGTALAVGASR